VRSPNRTLLAIEEREPDIASLSLLPLSWYLAAAALLIIVQALLIAQLRRNRGAHRRAWAHLEERLQFETLLSQLSAGLIHVPAAGIDTVLLSSLGEVVGVLGGDRGAIDEYAGVGPRTRIFWTSPGVKELPPILDAAQFPWTVARLKDNDVVRFSRTGELPEAAFADRDSYERAGTRSHLSLPLRAGGPTVGVLSVDAVHVELAWSDEFVERLRFLSEAFASALERRRMEVFLVERLELKRMLLSMTATFSAVSGLDFDREVKRGLRRIVEVVGIDRGAVIELSRDGKPGRSWTVDDATSAEGFPWMMAMVQRGEVVMFARIEELPAEASVDRETCLARGIKSQVALPLLAGGKIVGGLVFGAVRDERAWERDGLLPAFELVGEVFANALLRQQGEHEMQRLRQELAHIGRVSAMGELTASLAHELNQPLTAILNNAQVAQRLLAAEVVDVGEMREILTDIVADEKRAAEVIRGMRGLLEKGDLEYFSLDLSEVVAEIARLLMSDAVIRNVLMRVDTTSDLPRVRGDRGQLQQVVLNLVLNGLDAMRESPSDNRSLIIRTFREGEAFVGVSVRDSGSGIAERDAEHIFEPLYTTKAGGLGMGLAISRTIVGAHGGRLRADNNADCGATVQFTLPAEKAAA
jgi:signal transduction histidine kinase